MATRIVPLGQSPDLGDVPEEMFAQVIREDRFGEPAKAYEVERVPVPQIAPDEVLVHVMAAGISYNGVFAAKGVPLNLPRLHSKQNAGEDFHIGGTEGSGIVWQVGRDVEGVEVGEEVIVYAGWWDPDDPMVRPGGDARYAPSARVLGFEVNFGCFAQFTRVLSPMVVRKPSNQSWEEAATHMNYHTAYHQLLGFPEHRLERDDVVLVWGGAGGLGAAALGICQTVGARAVAVTSSDEKAEYCRSLGAVGTIDRRKFDHWGQMPAWQDSSKYRRWLVSALGFRKAIWNAVGERKSPRIVVEHPGELTLPTSCFVCERGGMVAICGGTSGYSGTLDLRYHWMEGKRLQGVHGSSLEHVRAIYSMFADGSLSSSLTRTFSFEEIPLAHQLMDDNQHLGNTAALISAAEPNLGRRSG